MKWVFLILNGHFCCRFSLADDCVLNKIVEKCPMNLTGADFYALCSDAMLNAVKNKIDILEKGREFLNYR